MSLSPNGMALLDACAKAIAFDQPSDIDLFPLNRERSFYEDTPQYLAKQVELVSQGRYTVRVAETALFDGHVQGVNRYLVRCPIDTPDGVVTELIEDMFLVSLGPYSNGFRLHAKEASPEDVAKYRAFVAKNTAERMEREAAEAVAKEHIEKIKDKLRLFVDACDNDELRSRLTNQLKNMSYSDPKLKDILMMCHRLDVDFAVVVEALA